MFNLNYWAKTFGLSLALGMSAPALFAEGYDAPDDEAMEEKASKQFEKLNLTPEQKERIKKIRQENQAEIKTMREALQAKRKKLKELLKSNGSSSEAQALHNEIQEDQKALSSKRFATMLKVREVLTPEQREKAAGHMKGMRDKMRHKKRGD